MLSLRQPGRSLLARTIARVLIAVLLSALVPFQASASTTSPALSLPHELPAIPQGALAGGEEVVVCVVVVVWEPSILTKSAFGELLSHTGTDPQPYAFAGEPLDPNSGFQYHRARWMDPRVGRFAGMDPLRGRSEDAASLHRYLYASADPANLVDPLGLDTTAAYVGTAIHNDIIAKYPNPAVLLGRRMIPMFFLRLFPDIADVEEKGVIEIKPLSLYGLEGYLQLETYIQALNYVGQFEPVLIGTGWHEGTWIGPGFGPWIEPTTQTPYVVLGNAEGVLFYYVPPPKAVLALKLVEEAAKAAGQRTREEAEQLAKEVQAMELHDAVVSGMTYAGWAATGVALTYLMNAVLTNMLMGAPI